MSSLAGALVSSPDINQNNTNSDHIDMHTSSFVDISPDTATSRHPKQDEEMGDLFGEDANVDFVHHNRSVFPELHDVHCPAHFVRLSDQHQTSAATSAPESRYSSPASAPPPDDGLSSPDRKRRQALEYEEDEEPNPLIEHRLEASVSIPNIPLPRSSDGHVRVPTVQARFFISLPFFFHSIGSFACLILSKWTPNLSTLILTLDRNTRRISPAVLMNATWA
jgi:RNA polymerase-associated protein LEO1